MYVPLIQLVIGILVVGVLVWGMDQLPIDEMFRKIAKVILICGLAIWAIIVLARMAGVSLG